MKSILKISAPILLFLGTLGLLLNEFSFHWGRYATLIFAAINAVGLVIFGFLYLRNLRAKPGG